MGIEQGKVIIKFDNGNVMTVSGKLPKNILEGDVVSFLVKSNEEGTILIETAKENMTKSLLDIVKNALEASEMYPTNENIDLVKSIVSNNLPMDTDTIQKAAFGYYSLKDISMDELAFILQEKLPINENTLDKIDLYIKNSVSIQKDVENLSAEIIKVGDSFDKMLAFSILTEYENSSSVLEILKFADKNGAAKQFINLIKDIIPKVNKDIDLSDDLFKGVFKELPYKEEFIKFAEKLADNLSKEISDKAVKTSLDKALNIKVGKDELGEQVNEFFQKLYEKTSAIKYVLPDGDKSDKINEAASNIKNNIEFMNEINNYKMYMQLPLLLNEKNMQADIYFFKNPRAKKVPKNYSTVMLSLNLANLGHLDTLIQKKGNVIDLKFSSKSAGVSDKIKKNIFTLGKLLSEKGYSIGNTTYTVGVEKFNILSNVEQETTNNENFTFDIKA